MPTIRQSIIACITRQYPFYSGCGTIGNHPILHNLVGNGKDQVWSTVPGGRVIASLDDHVGRAVYYAGDLDRKITWLCNHLVKKGDTVLDIGANIGVITLLLSSIVGKNGRVHAFEPNPILQTRLAETIQRNNRDNVCLHKTALGNEQGRLSLRVPDHNAGMGSLIRPYCKESSHLFDVNVQSLDAVVRASGIHTIDFMKIDVEGFESQVLKGGKMVFESRTPQSILIELNGAGGSSADWSSINFLRQHDYALFSIPRRFVRMGVKHFNPDNTKDLSPSHDILAVHRNNRYEEIEHLIRAKY